MDQKEIRKCKIRRRSLFLRCRYDRRIISGYLCTDRSCCFCGRCGCHRYLYAVSEKEGKQYLQ